MIERNDMNVKTRIAAFESQNEVVRRIATPTRAQSPGASPNSSGFGRDMLRSSITPRSSAASSPVNHHSTSHSLSEVGNGNSNPNTATASAVLAAAAALRPNSTSRSRTAPTTTSTNLETRSTTSSALSADGFSVTRSATVNGTSSTMAASEIRKTRLARSVSSNASVASEPPPGSLMERRKQIKESRLRQQRSPVAIKNTTSIGQAYSKRRTGSLTPTGGNSPVRSIASSANNSTQNATQVLKHRLNETASTSNKNVATRSRSVNYLTVPALSAQPQPKQQQSKQQPKPEVHLEPSQAQQQQPSSSSSSSSTLKSKLRPTPTASTLHSHRRFVHSISAESDDSNKSQEMVPSLASASSATSLQKRHPAQLAKKHRMQRMKRNMNGTDNDMPNITDSMPSMESDYDEEYDDVDYDTNEEAGGGGLENPPSIQRVQGNVSRDGNFLPPSRGRGGATADHPTNGSVSGVTTDDEATLTSVRRVVMEAEARQEEYSADLLRHSTPTRISAWPKVDDPNSGRRGMNPPTTATSREAFGEEKSDKAGGLLRTSSSSDYDSDQDGSPFLKKQQQQLQANHHNNGQPSQQQRQRPPGASTPDWTEIPDVNGFFSRSRSSGFVHHSNSNRAEDEESYGDNLSPSSMSYAERMRREERKKKSGKSKDGTNPEGVESPLLNKDDFEHYRQQLDNTTTKIAAGVVGCAVLGCLALGSVGLLLGPAAVGIGFGFMQIPEEQRNHMREKAAQAFESAQKSALNASDTISQSCAVTYKDSGVSQHIPPDMSRCFTATEDAARHDVGDVDEEEHSPIVSDNTGEGPLGTGKTAAKGIVGGSDSHLSPPKSKIRNKKVACLRTARIIPVNQIHALDPAAQPKAWLDVLACASTTDDEKHEAMEETLILAKDKRRARIFLEEGILDSMMWILGRYFEKTNRKPTDVWSKPDISAQESNSAKLAASCCVTLGKAHCASMHTDGDLLLMSLYERGTVPEERQLAQMLFEIPHHARVTKTSDPTVVEPTKEVFALKQLTLPQAEELARNIKALADGNQMSMVPQTNNHPNNGNASAGTTAN